MFANFDKRTLVKVTVGYFILSLLLFSAYILIDKPKSVEAEHIPLHSSYMSDPRQHYIEAELNEDQTREKLVKALNGVSNNSNLKNVAFTLSCDEKSCLMSFYGSTEEAKEKAAEAKLLFIHHLNDAFWLKEESR